MVVLQLESLTRERLRPGSIVPFPSSNFVFEPFEVSSFFFRFCHLWPWLQVLSHFHDGTRLGPVRALGSLLVPLL